MATATVRYICNGFAIMALPTGPESVQPATYYAADLTEVMDWLSWIFEPPMQDAPPPARSGASSSSPPQIALTTSNPLMNQDAFIWNATSGGYFVRQMQSVNAPGRPQLDEWCADLATVKTELTEIFAEVQPIEAARTAEPPRDPPPPLNATAPET